MSDHYLVKGDERIPLTQNLLIGRSDECDLARGDSNLNGAVEIGDFLAVLAKWGACGAPCAEDADLDGMVGILDFLIVLANWG